MNKNKKKRMKKVIALALAAAMASMAFTGCGSSGGSSEGSSKEVKESASNVNENATGEEIEKEVVNVGIGADPADLSPFGPETSGRTYIVDCLYETPGYFVDGEFNGVLAKDYELSEDETALTFHLYENIYDQAGNHFTASDMVFSFNTKAATGNFFSIDFIDSVEAVDDYTVQFNLKPPLQVTNIAYLVHNMYCVTEAAYNASADGMVTDGVISTSHYKVEDYQGGYLLTLKKYEDYWQEESLIADRSRANVKTINYYILTESNQRTMALESGTIDMCWSVDSNDVSKFMEGGEQSENYWVYESSDNISLVLLFNHGEGHKTTDINLRKAIGYSINSDTILQSVFNGHGAVNYDIARSSSTGFNESWTEQENFYQYDVEKAKEALAESGYNGETLTLLTGSEALFSDSVALIQGFCSAVGINVELSIVDPAVVTTYISDESAWDMVLTTTAAETYVVQPWLKHLDNTAAGTGKTVSFLADDTLQKLVTEAAAVETSTQDAIDECHDYTVDNAIIRGILNVYTCYVVPSDCKEVNLGYRKCIQPGACVYVE